MLSKADIWHMSEHMCRLASYIACSKTVGAILDAGNSVAHEPCRRLQKRFKTCTQDYAGRARNKTLIMDIA